MNGSGEITNLSEARIGVFVCHCGSNIAGYLDCEELVEYAAALPGVVYAKDNLYTCSEPGIAQIKAAIKEHGLTRVVVASCSPRTHMPLFKSACAEAGLNPYLFEMANIRDQCSWVHMHERDAARVKAMDLIRMAVAKAALLEPLEDIEASLVRKSLVLGGGVAGLSAASALADVGVGVLLVEREAELGGLVRRLNRIGPSNEMASDLLAPLIEQVEGASNVRLGNIDSRALAKLPVVLMVHKNRHMDEFDQLEHIEDTLAQIHDGYLAPGTRVKPFFRHSSGHGASPRNNVSGFLLPQRIGT